MSDMKYAMIGSGAMGYRYGVLLQETAGIHVDFIDAWDENVKIMTAIQTCGLCL